MIHSTYEQEMKTSTFRPTADPAERATNPVPKPSGQVVTGEHGEQDNKTRPLSYHPPGKDNNFRNERWNGVGEGREIEQVVLLLV